MDSVDGGMDRSVWKWGGDAVAASCLWNREGKGSKVTKSSITVAAD